MNGAWPPMSLEDCRRRLTRRDCLRTAGLGLSAVALPRLAYGQAPQPTAPVRPARSCILVYLLGGPPHLDMWDLKPEAPAEIRGPFQPIATSVPGIQVSEHLPLLARQADRYAIIRSVTHPNHFHTHMIYYTLTGRHMPNPNADDNAPNAPSRNDHPHMGSVVAYARSQGGAAAARSHAERGNEESPCAPPLLGDAQLSHTPPVGEAQQSPTPLVGEGRGGGAVSRLPDYVAAPELAIRKQPILLPGGNAGFLGPRYDPLGVNDDPREPRAVPAFARPEDVTAERFERRRALRAALDGRAIDSRHTRQYDAFYQSAADLAGMPRAADPFELEREPQPVRERYGAHRFGQSLLLARRLVEAGVAFVAVHFNYMSQCDGWDTHSNNFTCLQDELLPLLDQGLSALLDDLAARGLLEQTLVVTMGEFGRTPRINGNAGRDHWGHCASVVMAGGGVRGGQVLGASDRTGAYPAADPLDPADVVTTICTRLGLDPQSEMHDQLGRPMPLAAGRAIDALF